MRALCAQSERSDRVEGRASHMASLPVDDLADSFAEATARPTPMPVEDSGVRPKELPAPFIEGALRDIRGLLSSPGPSPLPDESPDEPAPSSTPPAPSSTPPAPSSTPLLSIPPYSMQGDNMQGDNMQGAALESQSGSTMLALLIVFLVLSAIGLFCCMFRKKARARTVSVGRFREHEMSRTNHFDNPWAQNDAARAADADYSVRPL